MPRPLKDPGDPRRSVSIRLPASLVARITERVEQRGETMTAWIERVLVAQFPETSSRRIVPSKPAPHRPTCSCAVCRPPK